MVQRLANHYLYKHEGIEEIATNDNAIVLANLVDAYLLNNAANNLSVAQFQKLADSVRHARAVEDIFYFAIALYLQGYCRARQGARQGSTGGSAGLGRGLGRARQGARQGSAGGSTGLGRGLGRARQVARQGSAGLDRGLGRGLGRARQGSRQGSTGGSTGLGRAQIE
ncbi:hypothetical protein ACLB2K_006552 [Fragaria x ananassa]